MSALEEIEALKQKRKKWMEERAMEESLSSTVLIIILT